MNTMVVYNFDFSDHSGQICRSPRAATLERIDRMGGTALLETALKVDPGQVDSNGFLRHEAAWTHTVTNQSPPRLRARP